MLIDNNELLREHCNLAMKEKVIAFDTEFMRDRTYYPTLSLIQIATKNTAFIVDMLSGVDHTPLTELFSCQEIIKVVHSARQDLELLYNLLNFIPSNLFDTQTAALFLGYREPPSFDLLVSDFLGKKITKELQYSDWLRRPLSVAQLKYAMEDATLLYKLFFRVEAKLKDMNRMEWAIEESNLVQCGSKFAQTIDSMLFKLAGSISKEADLWICYQLLQWREEKAKQLNIPRSRVLKDEAIMNICSKKLYTKEKLLSFRLRYNLAAESAEQIAAIVKSSETTTAVAVDQNNDAIIKAIIAQKKAHSTPIKSDLFLMLKILVGVIAKRFGIQEQLLGNTSELLLCAQGEPSKLDTGWRWQIIGELIEALKNGNVTIGYEGGEFFINKCGQRHV